MEEQLPTGDLARALWITEPGVAALLPTGLAPQDGESVTVRAVVSGISRGTEALVFHGTVPESEWARLRAPFQEGEFSFPVKYGYAMVGRIEDGGRTGERVFSLHPHQERFRIPMSAAFRIPDGVSEERAVLAPQMETALNATWDAAVRAGDRIAVIGGGVIGCLTAFLCARMPGTKVTLIDPNPERRAVADRLGFDFARPEETQPRGCDRVFHASSTSEGLNLALLLAGFEATLVEMSWYGAHPVAVALGGAFHSQRLKLVSSQVGNVAEAQRARWSKARRLSLALSLCADPALDVLVQEETPFADLPAALPGLLDHAGPLCHLVRY